MSTDHFHPELALSVGFGPVPSPPMGALCWLPSRATSLKSELDHAVVGGDRFCDQGAEHAGGQPLVPDPDGNLPKSIFMPRNAGVREFVGARPPVCEESDGIRDTAACSVRTPCSAIETRSLACAVRRGKHRRCRSRAKAGFTDGTQQTSALDGGCCVSSAVIVVPTNGGTNLPPNWLWATPRPTRTAPSRPQGRVVASQIITPDSRALCATASTTNGSPRSVPLGVPQRKPLLTKGGAPTPG